MSLRLSNIKAGNITASGTVSGGAVSSTGNITASGTVSGGAVSSTGNITASYRIDCNHIYANGYDYTNFGVYGYLNPSGAVGQGSGPTYYSVIAANRIKASEFNAASSKKIKNIQASLTDQKIMNEAIELFKTIPLYKYDYTDEKKHDYHIHYGLVAEEMPNKIYTDYVQSDYVPNIYSLGVVEYIDEKGIAFIKLEKSIQDRSIITNTDKVLCYIQNIKNEEISDINENLTIIDDNYISIYLSNYKNYEQYKKLLVYGTCEIIPTITKNNVFELSLCVNKFLLNRVDELELEIQTMNEKFKKLMDKIEELEQKIT